VLKFRNIFSELGNDDQRSHAQGDPNTGLSYSNGKALE